MNPSAGPPRLLVAEDDPDMREVLKLLLDEEGYKAHYAASLEEALTFAELNAYHLVVTDLFAASAHEPLASIEPLRQQAYPTPIGIMTSWRLAMAEAARQNYAFLLFKPFDVEKLLASIAASLNVPLTAEQERKAAVVRRYFEALNARDWDVLASLCTDDVTFSATPGTPHASPVSGRQAFRAYAETAFQRLGDIHFHDLVVYALPKGLAGRYEISWTDPRGHSQQQSGAATFYFNDEHIRQIGVRVNSARLQALMS